MGDIGLGRYMGLRTETHIPTKNLLWVAVLFSMSPPFRHYRRFGPQCIQVATVSVVTSEVTTEVPEQYFFKNVECLRTLHNGMFKGRVRTERKHPGGFKTNFRSNHRLKIFLHIMYGSNLSWKALFQDHGCIVHQSSSAWMRNTDRTSSCTTQGHNGP